MDNDLTAGQTIERSDQAWAAWLLQFAQSAVGEWHERDWLTMFEQAMAFAASHDESAHAQLPLTMCGPRTKHNLSLDEVKACVRSARQALRRFLRELEQSLHVPLMNAEIPFRGSCLFFIWGGRPEIRYLPTEKTIASQLAVEMQFRVGELFLRGRLSQIRRCLGCNRLFLAMHHQRFDRPECRMRHRVPLLKSRDRQPWASTQENYHPGT